MKSEDRIQQDIIMHVRNYCKDVIIFSVPNDGKDAKEQLRKKAMGLLTGVSDLILLKNGRTFFIEVKTEDGKQSDNQKKFQTLVENQGFHYFLVRSLEDLKKILDSY